MEQRSFGYWLKLKRKALDLTRERLGERVGCSAATIRKIEAEERRPSEQVVERLAEIFKIPKEEQPAFLRFARGDWKSAPVETEADQPWRASGKSPRSNIPATTTSLIAREKEIALVHEYLSRDDIRLVTLIGPPGIGKTRLSIEAARKSLQDFSDGVFFVPLAALEDPTSIPSTIIQVLGYLEDGKEPAEKQLMMGIGEKQLLLVLDNCEHLINEIAKLTSFLLSTCSYLKILTTSRESLRVSGEWLYSVPAFDLPIEQASINIKNALQYPALALFAERARAVRSDFSLNAENLGTVASICSRLDGLPLVIELMAARMRFMSAEVLLDRLTNQFVLTADGMRAASERQKTLNSAIKWSYNLLSPEEQKLFACLSVFSGGFTMDAAEAMFSQIFTDHSISNLIALLLDKCLLQHTLESSASVEARYTMLVTIQEFARQQLLEMGETTEIWNRHLTYFCKLAKQAASHLRGAGQLAWLDRLDAEYDNIRAALSWAQVSGAIITGLYIVTDLEMFWIYRAYLRETCLALENLLANPVPVDHIRVFVRAYTVGGHLQNLLGNHALSRAHAQEAERLCLRLEPLHKAELADARNVLTYTDVNYDPVRARQQYEENLKLFQEAGDQWNIAHTLYNIGSTLRETGDFISARQAFEQSLDIFRECGDNIRVVHQKAELAGIDFEQGKYMEAQKRYEEVLSFYRQARFNLLMAVPLHMLGTIAIREGDYAHAKARFSECLLFEQQKGTSFFLYECLISFAQIASAEGHFERAAQLLSATEAYVEAKGAPLKSIDEIELKRLTTILREELGDAKFEEIASHGRAMTMEQAIAYALEE